MKVLVACEESQTVCKAFREKGHEAYSCDTQECSGGHPEWHIQSDVLNVINGGVMVLQSGERVFIDGWDLMIGHPPCTYLSFAGIGYFNIKKYGEKAIERHRLKDQAMYFFTKLWEASIPKICLENPRGFPMQTIKPTQMIHPWYFGDEHKKLTCLWLKGLSRLNGSFEIAMNKSKYEPKPLYVHERKPSANYKGGELKARHFTDYVSRYAKIRSKTFPGIARAMAEQWG